MSTRLSIEVIDPPQEITTVGILQADSIRQHAEILNANYKITLDGTTINLPIITEYLLHLTFLNPDPNSSYNADFLTAIQTPNYIVLLHRDFVWFNAGEQFVIKLISFPHLVMWSKTLEPIKYEIFIQSPPLLLTNSYLLINP